MKKEGENMLIGITERGDAGVDFSWEYSIRNREVDAGRNTGISYCKKEKRTDFTCKNN